MDRLSAGRVLLGVGAGWFTEELQALEVPVAGRGTRMDSAVRLMRACWRGEAGSGTYGPFTLDREVCEK